MSQASKISQEHLTVPSGSNLLRIGKFVARSALIGSAGAVLVDRIGGNIRWKQTETVFHFEEPGSIGDSDTIWLVFPGLGQRSSHGAAQAVAPALDAPTVSMELPQRRPKLASIRQSFSKFVTENGIRRIRPYFVSMGNFLAADLLPAIPTDVEIDKGIFDSSPGHSGHAKQGDAVPKIISRLGYPGGILTKPIAAAASYKPHPDKPQEAGWRYAAKEAWRSISPNGSPNGASSMLWVFMAQRLCDPDRARIGTNIGWRLTPDAELAYIMPNPASRDLIVDVKGSVQALEQVLHRDITRLPIDGTVHAWPGSYPVEYQETISRWLGGTTVGRGADAA